MKAVLALLCLLPARLCAAPAPAEFIGYLSFWTQTCQGAACSLPRPSSVNRPLSLFLTPPSFPGEAASASARERLYSDTGADLYADFVVYAVCPYVAAAPAGDAPCAGLYYQAQLTLTGAAEAFCSAALNAGDALPWPVMTCGGRSAPGLRSGVTLHRLPF